MTSLPKNAVFLERATYRQRRLRDAARLLPILGAVLLIMPLLWAPEPGGNDNADAVIYTFSVWVILIALSAIISRRLQPEDLSATEDTSG